MIMSNAADSCDCSAEEFLQNLGDSGLFSPEEIQNSLSGMGRTVVAGADGATVARQLVSAGKLTGFQADAVLTRKFDQLVVGNYEVLERLGAGGMGTVYKARHRRMKRIVALKVLSRAASTSPTFLQRFQREVEVISRLTHPNIVMAFDADEATVGHFLVMEFVNGPDLSSVVLQRGPLPVPEAVDALLQSARALEYAHTQGIIHRDIKPANLLRDPSGVVKVADLGLARCTEALNSETTGLTQAGGVVGTVDYMPPEQAFDSTRIDKRADIYSLGCTFYFLLTGRPPYQGESLMAIFLKHREGPIPSLRTDRPDVPPALDAIFRKMVAKQANDRYQTMTELVQALEALGPITASPEVPAAPVDTGVTVALPAGVKLPPPAPPAATESVLLVEPSRVQANIIRRLLAELGTTTVPVVASGEKALEAMRAARPSVVVSTMHMDDMTGAQLLQKMRAEPALADIGFVLITASAADAGLGDAAHTALLCKPFDSARLGQALRSARSAP
jgi:serine/threonine protein kinase